VKKRKEREEGLLKNPKKPCHRKDASNIRCYNCKEMGHYVAHCPLKKEKGNKKHHAHVADVEEKDEEYVL
jgi:hypothetical protein